MEDDKVVVKDLYRLEENVELLQGLFDYEFLNCNTNTKTIKKDETFFAMEKGIDYIEEALKKGASGCVVEKDIDYSILEKYPDVTFIKVKNALETLQNLAAYKRALYNIPVIAITGSVGKTSTKDIVASVVGKKYKVLKTEGNFNNHIGLPITILKLKEHEALVLEMGMNHFHEIEMLSEIARPNIAIITNIGTSHIGILGSKRNIMKAKLEILRGLQETGVLIINNDCDLLKNWREKENKDDSFGILTFSIHNEGDVRAENIVIDEEKTYYDVKSESVNGNIVIPISGEPFVYNSLVAIAVANILKIEYEKVKEAIEEFKLTKKRMEIEEIGKIKYINDAYNASYESMKYAIDFIKNINAKRRILVLGDMFELGDYTEELHRKVGKEVEKSNIDVLITAGTYSKYIENEVKNVTMKVHLNNKEEVIEKLDEICKVGDVVLIKASNGMKFFEIVDAIKNKSI